MSSQQCIHNVGSDSPCHIELHPQPFSTVSCCRQHWANGLHIDVSREIKAWPFRSHLHRSYTCDTRHNLPGTGRGTATHGFDSCGTTELHWLAFPRGQGQEDLLAYISKLEILSPKKRFPCFHEAHTTTVYFEKKDRSFIEYMQMSFSRTRRAGVIPGGRFY